MGASVTPSLFDLSDRVAVVTGAAGHLGRSTAVAFAAAGAAVWLVGRRSGPLEELAAELNRSGGRAYACCADVTVDVDVAALVQAVTSASGRLDVLVNNAHVGRGGTLATSRGADFTEAAELALAAPARTISAFRKLLVAAVPRGSPSVINVCSMYGVVSPDPRLYEDPEQVNPPFYGAAKAGLLQLTRYAAVELAPEGVRVNAVTPGPFPASATPDFERRLAQRVPLGRVGRAEEIQSAMLFLASPASSFVTGAEIRVDGGWTAW
jgi:NAD(P)-dependent dehydrogenase (short-subunit alcohol dehydrogenase family)